MEDFRKNPSFLKIPIIEMGSLDEVVFEFKKRKKKQLLRDEGKRCIQSVIIDF